MRGVSCLGTDFEKASLQYAILESSRSAADFTDANLLGAENFTLEVTDILCRTTMPNGEITTR